MTAELTPDSSGVGVHGVTKALNQIGATSAWIGSQNLAALPHS
jgi:hypothetical protein